MIETARQQLKQALAANVSFDPQICRAYNFDMGEMPSVLTAQIQATPEAVVIARSVSDVQQTLRTAAAAGMPVTPRGQASSGFGGALPTRGGILLDMSAMTGILAVDEEKMTVDVEPGVVWKPLSLALARHGLDNRISPTSAPSATVGGWFAMGGVGIGSLRFGGIDEVVEEIDAVDLSGQVATCRGDELALHHQTCGTLGVMTRLRLKCRRRETLVPFAVDLPDEACAQLFAALASSRCVCDAVILHSDGYVDMRRRAGHSHAIDKGHFLAIVAIPESAVDAAKLDALITTARGKLLPAALAREEWEDRFYPMRIKKIGPTMLASEFFLPVERLAEVWRKIVRDLKGDPMGMEAFVVKGGKMAVLLYLPERSRSLLYPLRMAKVVRPLEIARRHDGAPYASGLWFAEKSKEIFGKEKYDAYLREKRRKDPQGLLNPGKIIGPAMRFLPFVNLGRLIHIGSRLSSPLARVLKYKQPARPQGHRRNP